MNKVSDENLIEIVGRAIKRKAPCSAEMFNTVLSKNRCIGMVQVHAFLICNAFFWEGVLKGMNFEDQILSKHLHDKNGNEISSVY